MSQQPRFNADTKKVPLAALRMAAARVELGAAADGSTAVPVTIAARSPLPVDHWYFGRIVHDFEGMRRSASISFDYCHDDSEILGVGNQFDIDEKLGLIVRGLLTPFDEKDRASEVIFKSGQGVPYEASIFFDENELVLEYVPEGMSTPVNGYQFEGPGVVAREWRLRNLAICPNGQDRNTAVQFSADQSHEVKVIVMPVGKAKSKLSKKTVAKKAVAATKLSKKGPAPKSATKLSDGQADDSDDDEKDTELEDDSKTDQSDEAPTDDDSKDESATVACPNCQHEFAVPDDEDEGEAEAVALDDEAPADDSGSDDTKLSKKTGKDFITAFGQQGAVWFVEGKSFAQAQTLFNKSVVSERDRLVAENKQLKSKLSKNRGAKSPVSFSDAEGAGDKATQNVPSLGKNLSKFAAAIKLPQRNK